MLKTKIAEGERLVGTFLKTPHSGLIEVLGQTGIDFVVLDAEHAPFTLTEIDSCMLAARAVELPIFVRLVEGTPANILQVLDLGATGIVVPQVNTAEDAQAIVQATRYGAQGRGFAGTTRAGGFGTLATGELVENARRTVVIVQIESEEGVRNVAEIAATPGVDACFVGRADLSVSMGLFNVNAPEIEAATKLVIEQCEANDIASMVFVSDMAECPAWFTRGARVIAVGSEHKAIQSYFEAAKTGVAKASD